MLETILAYTAAFTCYYPSWDIEKTVNSLFWYSRNKYRFVVYESNTLMYTPDLIWTNSLN